VLLPEEKNQFASPPCKTFPSKERCWIREEIRLSIDLGQGEESGEI